MFHTLIHSNIASTPRSSFPCEGLLKHPRKNCYMRIRSTASM